MSEKFWVAERRLLSDAQEAHSWLTVAYEQNREDAETKYNLLRLHLNGHEMRLVAPDGLVVRRDPYPALARIATAERWELAR